MSKSTKKILPLIIMLVVVVLFGVAYFAISKMDLNAEPEEESTVFAIQSLSADNITSVTFNDKEGNPLTFVLEDHVWYCEADRGFPVDYDAVHELVSGFGTILGTREFESDNGEFGFDTPQNVVKLTYSDDNGDTVVEYTVGITNDFNSGTYLRDDVTGKIYLSSANIAEPFVDKMRDDFIELDIAAYDVEPTSTHTVTLVGADGTKNIITDGDGIDEFIGDPFCNIDCTDWVKYKCTDEDMAGYGITKGEDKPYIMLNYKTTVSVTDENGESSPKRQEAVYHIWFGDTLEDGSVYYTITDSTFVYKLSKDRYDVAMSYLTYAPAPETETETVTTELTEAQ